MTTLHIMAARLQQRFWYSSARWNTRRRMGRRLINAGLHASGPKLTRALLSVPVRHLFGAWLRRVCGKLPAPPYRTQDILSAYCVSAYSSLINPETPGAAELVQAARSLVAMLDGCFLGGFHEPTALCGEICAYMRVFEAWMDENGWEVRLTLLEFAVKRAINTLSKRQPRDEDAEFAARFSILIGGDAAYRQLLLDAPEMRVVHALPSSRHWGPGNVSIFRMMHEVLMDQNFVLDRATVFTGFAEEYRRIDAVRKFLADLRAVLMFPIRDAASLTLLAGCTCFEDKLLPGDENLGAFIEELVPAIVGAIPMQGLSDEVQRKWDQQYSRAPVTERLEFLRDSALDLRYAYALLDLGECRRRVHRHPSGFHHTQVDMLISKSTETKHTEPWLLGKLHEEDTAMLLRLAAGDPFALLRFHDRSIARFVLEDLHAPPVPEILYFDLERMHSIRAQILCPSEARRVMEAIASSDDVACPRLSEAVAALRNLIFICRFQHGNRLAELVCDLAKRALECRDGDLMMMMVKS